MQSDIQPPVQQFLDKSPVMRNVRGREKIIILSVRYWLDYISYACAYWVCALNYGHEIWMDKNMLEW